MWWKGLMCAIIWTDLVFLQLWDAPNPDCFYPPRIISGGQEIWSLFLGSFHNLSLNEHSKHAQTDCMSIGFLVIWVCSAHSDLEKTRYSSAIVPFPPLKGRWNLHLQDLQIFVTRMIIWPPPKNISQLWRIPPNRIQQFYLKKQMAGCPFVQRVYTVYTSHLMNSWGMFFQDGLTGSAWGDWANYTESPLRAFDARKSEPEEGYLGMDQYLLIPFLGGWTSIYQLFWCEQKRGTIGFDTLPYLLIKHVILKISQLQWQVELTTLASFCWGKTATRQIVMTELHKHLLPWKRVTAQGYCSLKSRVMKVVGAHVFDFYNAVSAWYAYLFGSWHLVTIETLDPQQLWEWSTPPALVLQNDAHHFWHQNMCQKVDTFPISYCTFIYFFDNIYIYTQFTIQLYIWPIS